MFSYVFFEINNWQFVQRSDGASIPIDQSNTDYQKYLEWLAEGNEPEHLEG
jgi:hypothetical protein